MALKWSEFRRINWFIVAFFFAVMLFIGGLFFYQSSQATDKTQLRIETESLQTKVTEVLLLVKNKDRVTEKFFSGHLGDLSENLDDSRRSLEKKGYEKSLASERVTLIKISGKVSGDFHDLSLAYNDQKTIDEVTKKLNDEKKAMATLLNKL